MTKIFYIILTAPIMLILYIGKEGTIGFWFLLPFWLLSVGIIIGKSFHKSDANSSIPDPDAAQRIENLRIKLEQDKLASMSQIVSDHSSTLARRRLATIRKDDYGIEDRSLWVKEIDYFISKVVTPRLGTLGHTHRQLLIELINETASAGSDKIRENQKVDDLTPIEFELWCSKVLEKRGWRVRTTKATGDQGADIIAEKNDLVLVIQCKLYSSPVGNKAVQEAYSAQRHYAARASAVVTNSGFTRSAQELALSTGVLLLHHSHLDEIDNMLLERGRTG